MAITQIYGHQLACAWDWAPRALDGDDLGGPARSLRGRRSSLSQEDDRFSSLMGVAELPAG